jgi:5-deoxy-glucuronate isomerase
VSGASTSSTLVATGPGGRCETLLEPGAEGRLGTVRTDGSVTVRTGDDVAWVLVEGGTGTIAVGDRVETVDARDDVFDAAGWSALVGPRGAARLDGDLRATVVWRHEARPIESRLIAPAEVVDEDRGDGTTARRVRTYVNEGPLIVGETINPPGLWSSYPPHRHAHEEVYLYRTDPPEGFGLQMRSESDADERAVVVRDGRIQRITSGWHPVVAAPGTRLYYLWALAGDTDTVDTQLDARYV